MDKIGEVSSGENPKIMLKLIEKLDHHKVDYKIIKHGLISSGE